MENSKIEWTKNTLQFWWGCDEVDGNPACDNCYARAWAERFGWDIWGHDKPRRPVGSAWKNVGKWQRKAAKAGRIDLVFTSSMSDIFEKSMPLITPTQVSGTPIIAETTGALRDEFFGRISKGHYPNLVFQFLTKRPPNIMRMVPKAWHENWPRNVWVGTSAGDQENVDRLVPHLLMVPAPVRFLSAEPLTERIDISAYLIPHFAADDPRHYPRRDGLEQVIVGGESGGNARPMHPDWVRDLRDQCQDYGTAFFFKQWGEWAPNCLCGRPKPCRTTPRTGGKMGVMFRCGKKHAGRTLDARTWDEIPQLEVASA